MRADRGADNGYPVLSEYFDTADRTSYWQKQFGVANRRRLRSRVYGRHEGPIPASAFIEIKHKLDGITVKRRVAVDIADLPRLSEGVVPDHLRAGSPSEQRILSEITELLTQGGCRPVVQIRYFRFAYDSGPDGTIRITFDIDPRCRFRRVPLISDDQDFELPLLPTGSSVMEVKTIGQVPYWFRDLVGEFNLIPSSFSKYSTALENYEFVARTPNPGPAASRCTAPAKPTASAAVHSGASVSSQRNPIRILSFLKASKVP